MKSEKASSAFRMSVERLALRVGVLISVMSYFDGDFVERGFSLVFLVKGVFVKDFFCFMLSVEIEFKFHIDAMNFPHDVLHLTD